MIEILQAEREALDTAAAHVAARVPAPFPEFAIVLGSGLGRFADRLTDATVIPFAEIPGFPVSTVAGHAGRLVVGEAAGRRIACLQGRLHVYEGHSPRAVAMPLRLLRRLGAGRVLLTNASGGIDPDLAVGDLMAIEDHINLSGRNPLEGPNDPSIGPRFFDMSEAYDPALREALLAAGVTAGVRMKSGVYVHVLGPNFETPAEIRAFAALGAHAVGMSTVPETLVARHAGMKVAGLCVITNAAAGLANEVLSHAETLAQAERAYDSVERVLLAFLSGLPAA